MATAKAARPRRASKSAATPALRFEQRLVLNQWITSLFGVPNFDDLADRLRDPGLEGQDNAGVSNFHVALSLRLDKTHLPDDVLLQYDENIRRHWRRITESHTERRGIKLKYFQYLALLFTEIYLDRYFDDAEKLLDALNRQAIDFNQGKSADDAVPLFVLDQLNKLAFWMATGSGKTLLMHCHLLQYQHYLRKAGRERELNRIILLTPNEGLSRQHLDEFEKSGIDAELFKKDGRGLFAGYAIEIIDMPKLREDGKEKTVSVEAFEGNNLVFVDEGHRGSSGESWMDFRSRLCAEGFSFEYSATFGQAMKASKDKDLANNYARWILFDYSYKYFYRDGYGKDYRILNLADDHDDDQRRLYLTASLLTFYQQSRLFVDRKQELAPFLLESPLWVFVGANVNAVRTDNKRQVSDVIDILLYLQSFVRERAKSVAEIERLLSGNTGLLNKNQDIFANAFAYLGSLGMTPDVIFADILNCVFNAQSDGALHLDDLKGVEGEVGLRIGDYDHFGVINVGDANKLLKLCRDSGLNVAEKEFAASLFQRINDKDSPVKVLIGSKKFTEGWSSWRVSTMGLMHVGKSEGSEIIQLFGRGVRLRGHGFGLKRSGYVTGIQRPKHIGVIETLNILGVRADYMQEFRKYLEDEGLSPDEDIEEFVLPTVKLDGIPQKRLRVIRVKDNLDFKRDGPHPALGMMDEIKKRPVIVDWYPRLQALVAKGLGASADAIDKQLGQLTRHHLAFMDFDAIWFELHRLKNERAWFNFDLPRDAPRTLLEDPTWYKLYIPADELKFTSFDRFRRWQEIAVTLLTKYCDRYYKSCQSAFEYDNLEYQDLSDDDPNMVDEYRVLVAQSETAIIQNLRDLKEEFSTGNMQQFRFDRHLYNPIIHAKGGAIEVKPVALNQGERDFVLALKTYCEKNSAFLEGKELYLLRNRSRAGIGFFQKENFYPDFILWLLAAGKQYVTFVEPHGIRMDNPDDPKYAFAATIKELEGKLGDPYITLNSFVVSVTPYAQSGGWFLSLSREELESRHVLFLGEDNIEVCRRIVEMSLAVPTP